MLASFCNPAKSLQHCRGPVSSHRRCVPICYLLYPSPSGPQASRVKVTRAGSCVCLKLFLSRTRSTSQATFDAVTEAVVCCAPFAAVAVHVHALHSKGNLLLETPTRLKAKAPLTYSQTHSCMLAAMQRLLWLHQPRLGAHPSTCLSPAMHQLCTLCPMARCI